MLTIEAATKFRITSRAMVGYVEYRVWNVYDRGRKVAGPFDRKRDAQAYIDRR